MTKIDRTRTLVVALMVGLLLALTAGTKPAEAAFPGENGRIAFESDRDGNSEIYAMNPDGSGQTRLTKNVRYEANPAVSPDGKRIAFVSNRDVGGVEDEGQEVYVMDAVDRDGNGEGDNLVRLTNDTAADYAPAFSPDGRKISFQSYRDGDSEIFVTNSDGTGQATRLTKNTTWEGEPDYSPDGKRIFFKGDLEGGLFDDKAELYAMDARDADGDGNGDNITQVASDPAIDYSAAAISPDGTKLAYQDYRDGDSEIYVKNLDGTGTPVRLTTNAYWDGFSAFSPDGTRIAYVSERPSGVDGQEEIYAMDVEDRDDDGNGDDETRLTDNQTSDYRLDWGPTDTTVPTVVAVSPRGNTVSPGANAVATFSEAMDEASVEDSGTVTLKRRGSAVTVPATVNYDAANKRVVLNPNRNLVRGASYTATITTAAKDEAGNALAANKTWSFKVRT